MNVAQHICIGPNCWGRDADAQVAVRNARKNHSPSLTGPFRYILYATDDPDAGVNDMGDIVYRKGFTVEEVRRSNTKRKR